MNREFLLARLSGVRFLRISRIPRWLATSYSLNRGLILHHASGVSEPAARTGLHVVQ